MLRAAPNEKPSRMGRLFFGLVDCWGFAGGLVRVEIRETRGTRSVRAELVEAQVGITSTYLIEAALRQAQGERWWADARHPELVSGPRSAGAQSRGILSRRPRKVNKFRMTARTDLPHRRLPLTFARLRLDRLRANGSLYRSGVTHSPRHNQAPASCRHGSG